MILQQIFNDLIKIAKRPSSADQLKAFQEMVYPLLYASKTEDEQGALPLAYSLITPEQVKALENPEKVVNPNEFQQIILFLDKLYQDTTLNLNIRLSAAGFAFSKYQSTIPASGLPLDNEHIKGCLRWGHRVLDINITGSPFEEQYFSKKIFHAEWLSSFYNRRNANALAAECYAQLASEALKLTHCKYFDVCGFQKETIAYYKAAITPEHTLRSPEINAVIRAIKKHIAFCQDIPEDKKTYRLYVSPAGALQQLNSHLRGESIPPAVTDGGATTLDEDLEESLGEIIPATAMWDHFERRDAERTVTKASGLLGQILAKTPKADDEEPDFKQAAIWLRVAQNCAYIDLSEALEITQIKAELAALEAPTRAVVLHNANNPAASLNNERRTDLTNSSSVNHGSEGSHMQLK